MPNKKKSSLNNGKTNKKRKAISPLQDTEQCTGVTRAKTSQTGSTSIQNKHKQTSVTTVSEPTVKNKQFDNIRSSSDLSGSFIQSTPVDTPVNTPVNTPSFYFPTTKSYTQNTFPGPYMQALQSSPTISLTPPPLHGLLR